MRSRGKRALRCPECALVLGQCLCASGDRLATATHVALVMPRRENKKSTATGPLALGLLRNSRLYVHGERDAPLDLRHLHDRGRRVLVLLPSEDARVLTSELVAADPRPVTLVVVDGNWRQASRAARRVPGLEQAERVCLSADRGSVGSTLEAIARSLGVLEGPEIEAHLLQAYQGKDQQPSPPQSEPEMAAPVAELTILYEDEQLVCVNKPSGMLVHRGWGKDGVPALQVLRDQLGEHLFPVHRLDRATSGALLFAKSSGVARAMQQLFQAEQVSKRYLALCRGKDPLLSWVDHPLTKEPGRGERRPAQTAFRFLGSYERYGLYEALPKTGRGHQIRRHLKHMSHPIIGDVRYGKGEHNRHFREVYDFARLALHCAELSFVHPGSGVSLQITADLPLDFLRLLRRLGLDPSLELSRA